MTNYKIITSSKNIKAKYPGSIVESGKTVFFTHDKWFTDVNDNQNTYNKAANTLIDILYKGMMQDKYFNHITGSYVKQMGFTSMDRPYGTGSHAVKDNACDFYVFPYELTPFIYSWLIAQLKYYKFTVFISLNNHHIHFNLNPAGYAGVEMSLSGNGLPVLPKNGGDNFDDEIERGVYKFHVDHNLKLFALPIMMYYEMARMTDWLIDYRNASKSAIPSGDRDGIIKAVCGTLGTTPDDFKKYLEKFGEYNDFSTFAKQFSPDEFLKWTKKKQVR